MSGASAATAAAATELPFACDECDARFGLERSLKRHKSQMHGAPLSKSAERRRRQKLESPSSDLPAEAQGAHSLQARTQMLELLTPIRQHRRELERRLDELQLEVADIRKAIRDYDHTLKLLDPPLDKSPTRKKLPLDLNDVRDVKNLHVVENYLNQHPELAQGFTINRLRDGLRNAGNQVGQHKLERIVEHLHGNGVVRKDRVVQGGGYSYVLIGQNGATNGTA